MKILDLSQLPDDELAALVTLLQLELEVRTHRARWRYRAMRAQEAHDRRQAEKQDDHAS